MSRVGLYDSRFEKDACGIGLYVNLNGLKKHEIVRKSLSMLCKLEHRGGQGVIDAGDGAGIMTEIPHELFTQTMNLPSPGRYAVGMVFFQPSDDRLKEKINLMERMADELDCSTIEWREVPVDATQIGEHARVTQPVIYQWFISCPFLDEDANERVFYELRRKIEKVESLNLYIASLSTRTIVYKGMLTPVQIDAFYLDLQSPHYKSTFGIVHSRFSTNTFPSWERAHPNRMIVHNGEINTLRGNIDAMRAREGVTSTDLFEDVNHLFPVLQEDGSDSSMLDNAFEFFTRTGRSIAHTAMMLIPEPFVEGKMEPFKRDFYQYHSSIMEPWDGPTGVVFTDGRQIGAILDRNGLRPMRYVETLDGELILSSETGVIPVDAENVKSKQRLRPGQLLLIDLIEKRLIPDQEIKETIAKSEPYHKWLKQMMKVEDRGVQEQDVSKLDRVQRAFGYTKEDIEQYMIPLINDEKDPIGSMGHDQPIAVLSTRPRSLFHYFKQHFAQVTNPPIDALREKIVTATFTWIGPQGDPVHTGRGHAKRVWLDHPIIDGSTLDQISERLKLARVDTTFTNDLEASLEALLQHVSEIVRNGANVIVLSDRYMSRDRAAMPALLVLSAVHQHLIRENLRSNCSVICESGEVREVHQAATLIGYGADAVYPYVAYATIQHLVEHEQITHSFEAAIRSYQKAVVEGIVKIMSKMGISTIQSYRGAQIFEAVGLDRDLIETHFRGTTSQLSGIGFVELEDEAKTLHKDAYETNRPLEAGSDFQWRADGEEHAFNPKTIHLLQRACRENERKYYDAYVKLHESSGQFIRQLFAFKEQRPVAIDEVEPITSIVRRFKTGAMSFGSLSKEAHETLAIAMNQIGAKSNSGEGGEDRARFVPDEFGNERISRIKQVASGRFGVTAEYLYHADEIQIKMAQGAKPGEGGQLPGNKVYPWVAEVRGSVPGVGLISPPPHHDIYSIEDLAQLIFDLKHVNPNAKISVKLVSKSGVGTIAAGVAKANADTIVISGYDGGTGASPKTSIKHTGLPWELGLLETHQTLALNGLRGRVTLETDGKLMTGRDIVMAAIFGAEEFAFATAPLVVLGCIMMRACHLDTCPVGVATQDPVLRQKFMGKPEHVVNLMTFLAEEVREILASLGVTSLDEVVGRTDLLEESVWKTNHPKARRLDLSPMLSMPTPLPEREELTHPAYRSYDHRKLIPAVSRSITSAQPTFFVGRIRNTDRAVGTQLGFEVTKVHGQVGLADDTISLRLSGSAGQSLGAFLPNGITISVIGDANDYIGKGLSGGKLALIAEKHAPFDESEQMIAGNVCLYGATSGQAFFNGHVGERFAVRNSGATAVVEGVGDHGCEYMTGGTVLVLGQIGRNFAAGMSGGTAYIYGAQAYEQLVNEELVSVVRELGDEDIEQIYALLEAHQFHTDSVKARTILESFEQVRSQFVKVVPRDYANVLDVMRQIEAERPELSEADRALELFRVVTEGGTA
ncbi:glutamate synthase large subunit [Exiguobacterium aestuarii]|uniref:glutamate synthase large subunit n=1 Tax=Exiguobacterium aestuarii TaxID=273527 RepID=UPI001CD2E67D|nr:glutamate synthase large subunit [Exiguobacterium aestuarii]MCA0980165.1 glutamate synthase large subunit [Exiguobacterium aestuarii]